MANGYAAYIATAWQSAQQSASGLARRNYMPRIVGLTSLSLLAFETYFLYRPDGILLVYGMCLIVWPHCAFVLASRSLETSKRREYTNIYFDSFIGGVLISALHGSLMEAQAVLFSLCSNNMSLGGVRMFVQGFGSILAGIVLHSALFGVHFVPFAGVPTAVTAALLIFLYITATNYTAHRQAQNLIRAKKELEFLHQEVVSQRDILSEQAVEIEIANTTLQETNLLLEQEREELESANQLLDAEKDRADYLLRNILPDAIADRLKAGETNIAERYESVSVLFADIVGFTNLSMRVPPEELVETLDTIFRLLDGLADRHGIEKIKTIGDCYMAVAGAPVRAEDHALRMARFALEAQILLSAISTDNDSALRMRIGIHAGPIVAGVIGKKKFAYDLWGDAVNTASRMESHGEPNTIHVSSDFATALSAYTHTFTLVPRGETTIKGKGVMQTFYLQHMTPSS
jgi:class 3 adenylate cyclase